MKPPGAVRLIVRTVDLGECIRRCAEYHRHLPVVVGGRVGFEVSRLDRPSLQPMLFGADPGEPCAWGIVGRPVARVLDAAGWVEYTRGIVPPTPRRAARRRSSAQRRVGRGLTPGTGRRS